MAGREMERVWAARLRWRRRGAWQWPAVAIAVVVDAVLLHEFPIAGTGGGMGGALLLSVFFNLVTIAALVPGVGWLVRRRRPALPRVVAEDRSATWLVAALAVVLAALGLAHQPAVRAADADLRAQAVAVRRYVATRAPGRYRRGVDRMDTWKQAPDLFRTCVPGPDPRRWLCLFVFTDSTPPRVRLDRDQEPNSRIAGADNPGREAP